MLFYCIPIFCTQLYHLSIVSSSCILLYANSTSFIGKPYKKYSIKALYSVIFACLASIWNVFIYLSYFWFLTFSLLSSQITSPALSEIMNLSLNAYLKSAYYLRLFQCCFIYRSAHFSASDNHVLQSIDYIQNNANRILFLSLLQTVWLSIKYAHTFASYFLALFIVPVKIGGLLMLIFFTQT